jgi:hypothetical protein
MQIGDRVRIDGNHPHAGREAVITASHCFTWGAGIRVRLDSGEFCYVSDPSRQRLIVVNVG